MRGTIQFNFESTQIEIIQNPRPPSGSKTSWINGRNMKRCIICKSREKRRYDLRLE